MTEILKPGQVRVNALDFASPGSLEKKLIDQLKQENATHKHGVTIMHREDGGYSTLPTRLWMAIRKRIQL